MLVVQQVTTGQGHPILEVLAARGLTQAWLAEQTEYSPFHLNRVFRKRLPAAPKVRRACARALGIDESVLFHIAPTSEPATEKVA